MAMAVALTGFTHTLAAEENILTLPAEDLLQQDVSEQKPETEILISEFETLAQTVSQPADNLLSDLKVDPFVLILEFQLTPKQKAPFGAFCLLPQPFRPTPVSLAGTVP